MEGWSPVQSGRITIHAPRLTSETSGGNSAIVLPRIESGAPDPLNTKDLRGDVLERWQEAGGWAAPGALAAKACFARVGTVSILPIFDWRLTRKDRNSKLQYRNSKLEIRPLTHEFGISFLGQSSIDNRQSAIT